MKVKELVAGGEEVAIEMLDVTRPCPRVRRLLQFAKEQLEKGRGNYRIGLRYTTDAKWCHRPKRKKEGIIEAAWIGTRGYVSSFCECVFAYIKKK